MTTKQGIAIYTDLDGYYDNILASHESTMLILRTYLNLTPEENNYIIFIVIQPGKVYIEDFKLSACLKIYNNLIINSYQNVINI